MNLLMIGFCFGVFVGWLVTRLNGIRQRLHECENCWWFNRTIQGKHADIPVVDDPKTLTEEEAKSLGEYQRIQEISGDPFAL